MDLMCFFFEDREFKNPELWSGTQSDRIFAASLRARPCAITPGDKPGSMRAGQSTTSALSWTLYKAGVEWLNFHLSTVQNLYTNFSPNAESYLPIPLPTMALCTSLMNRQNTLLQIQGSQFSKYECPSHPLFFPFR